MTDLVLSHLEFEGDLFKKLKLEVSKISQRIAYIANGGINKGEVYRKAIRKFTDALDQGLSDETQFSWSEILYITNELATSRSYFELLIEYEEFESFILIIKKYEKLSIYKKLFQIYFNYYSLLNNSGSMSILKMQLKSILRHYNGKNKYMSLLQLHAKEYLFGALPNLLEYYRSDFEAIKRDFKLQDDFEFSKSLLNLKIIQELKNLTFDEHNEAIFSTIISRKEMFFDEGLTLKEYVTKVLIDRAIDEQQPFPIWQTFILKLVGDPRSIAQFTAALRSWEAIGESRKEFFIKTLSKDDFKLFLDALSDSVSDTNYHYRKAFWLQFLDKVLFAKIMISNDAFLTLNSDMKEKFKLSNDSYGRLQGLQSQSAIYIDFGKIKVIEFTHSGQVRGYRDCPINLHQKHYDSKELNALENHPLHLFSIKHASPRTYTWQERVLEYMNHYLGLHVKKEDVEIPEDREKREAFLKYKRRYY